MSDDFDPYHVWLGIPADQQPPTHYRLLGIELFESSADVIDAAASRQTAYLHQIASGPNRKASQKILTEVAAARRCLLNADSKIAYDQTLKTTDSSPQAPVDKPQTVKKKNAQIGKGPKESAPSDSKVTTGDSSGTKVFQCGQCKTRIRASASKAKSGLTCPKCKSQIRRAPTEAFAPINITPEPAGVGQTKKKKKPKPPVWAHPAFIVGGGTCLILLAAFAAIKFSGSATDNSNTAAGSSPSVTNDELTSAAGGVTSAFDLSDPNGFLVAPPQGSGDTQKPATPIPMVVDDSKAKFTGRWESFTTPKGFTGNGYRTTNDKNAKMVFPFTIRENGNYEFRLKSRISQAYGSTVPVTVQVGDHPAKKIVVNMKSASADPGYKFLAVTYITAKQSGTVQLNAAGANGKVYADALEILKRKPGDNGLIGYWSLDRLTKDSTVSDIGMLKATIKGAELVKGVIGKAAVIGAGDTLLVPKSIIGVNQGAVAMWLRQDSKGAALFLTTEGTTAHLSLRTNPDGQLRARIAKQSDAPVIKTNQKVEVGKWYHLVATWKKGAETVIYWNGKEIGRQKGTPELKGVSKVRFAAGATKGAKQTVSFDEIGFYNRLIQPNEVDSLFKRRKMAGTPSG